MLSAFSSGQGAPARRQLPLPRRPGAHTPGRPSLTAVNRRPDMGIDSRLRRRYDPRHVIGSAPSFCSSTPIEVRRSFHRERFQVRLTIESIAALAEVSRSTVSRVLNNHPGVNPSVRQRVQQVIADHNYAPKAAARSLASSRTDTIGLLIPRSAAVSLSDPFIESMIQSIFEAAAQQRYFAMLAMLTADMEPAFYHRILRSRHFDGLIMFSSDIDDPILPLLIKDGGPLVLIGRHPYFVNVVSVDVDNREGAREAVAHLIGLGHRRIGLINGQMQMEAAQARRDGYKQALLEAGVPIDAELMVDGFYSDSASYTAMQTLLDLYEPPTAVFAASDGMAIGAMRAIFDRGLRVPDDVALIGYDDLPLAARANPPLTSVHQPIADMGAHAVRVLVEQIRRQGPATSVRLPARLVVRESSGGGAAVPSAKGGTVLTRGAPTLAM
jgi:DNA-binding LacI/PurR family transcriptional regulator